MCLCNIFSHESENTMDTTVTRDTNTYTSHLIPGGEMLVITLKSLTASQQTVIALDNATRTAKVLTQHRVNPDRFDVEMEDAGWAIAQMAHDLHKLGMEFLRGPDTDPKLVKLTIGDDDTVTLEDVTSGEAKSSATVTDDGVVLREHTVE